MVTEITNLDDDLSMPDGPPCGSEDVVVRETLADGTKVYYCEKCGHVWAERP